MFHKRHQKGWKAAISIVRNDGSPDVEVEDIVQLKVDGITKTNIDELREFYGNATLEQILQIGIVNLYRGMQTIKGIRTYNGNEGRFRS